MPPATSITSVLEPLRPNFTVPDGSWAKDAAHSGTLPSPFVSSLPDQTADVFRSVAERFGLLIETVATRTIGYETYIQAVPLGGGGGSKPPPAPLLWLLVRVVPAMRRRTAAARRAVESGLIEELPRRWQQEWKPEFRQRLVTARNVDLAELNDIALLAEFESVSALAADGVRVHFDLFVPYLLGVHGLVAVCEHTLGWDSDRALTLLTGHSSASSEPTVALRSVAAVARTNAAAVAAIDDRSPGLVARLHEAAPDVAEALDAWVEEWGHRCLDYDPAAPTYAEQPELIAHLLRSTLRSTVGDAGRSEPAVAAARGRLSGADREQFDRALTAARRVYPLREDNVHLTGTMPAALVRRVALAMGTRLTHRKLLATPDEVFLCEFPEVERALLGDDTDLRPLVARRRAEMAWVEEHPGRDTYGPVEGDPPDMSVLPLHARRVNTALIWAMAQEFAAPVTTESDGGLRGVAASPGRYTGTVRHVTNDDDFFDVVDGDVIVCRVATTSWSVLMGVAGAIVCDSGGAVSHTAVIARELGIPAVLGTGHATSVLRTGMTVTVDGSAGVVEVPD